MIQIKENKRKRKKKEKDNPTSCETWIKNAGTKVAQACVNAGLEMVAVVGRL